MTCSFCGSRNNDGEHRCRKCGRRPGDTLNGEFSLVRTQGALATKFELQEQPRGQTAVAEPKAPRPTVRGVQQSLFPERQSNVIQFSEYAPQKPTPQHPPAERPVSKAPVKPRTANRRRGVVVGQGSLDFMPPQPATPRTL